MEQTGWDSDCEVKEERGVKEDGQGSGLIDVGGWLGL